MSSQESPTIDLSVSEDPGGEAAYHRAALDGAKMKPPRVPNPLNYPNSPTAQAHIKSHTAHFSNSSKPVRVPNPFYVCPPEDVHSRLRAMRDGTGKHPTDDSDDKERKASLPAFPPELSGPDPAHYSQDHASRIRAPPQHARVSDVGSGSGSGAGAGSPYTLPQLHQPGEHPHYGRQGTSQHTPSFPPSHDSRGPDTVEPHFDGPSGPGNPFGSRRSHR